MADPMLFCAKDQVDFRNYFTSAIADQSTLADELNTNVILAASLFISLLSSVAQVANSRAMLLVSCYNADKYNHQPIEIAELLASFCTLSPESNNYDVLSGITTLLSDAIAKLKTDMTAVFSDVSTNSAAKMFTLTKGQRDRFRHLLKKDIIEALKRRTGSAFESFCHSVFKLFDDQIKVVLEYNKLAKNLILSKLKHSKRTNEDNFKKLYANMENVFEELTKKLKEVKNTLKPILDDWFYKYKAKLDKKIIKRLIERIEHQEKFLCAA